MASQSLQNREDIPTMQAVLKLDSSKYVAIPSKQGRYSYFRNTTYFVGCMSQSLQNREDIPTYRLYCYQHCKGRNPFKTGKIFLQTRVMLIMSLRKSRNPFKTGKIFLPKGEWVTADLEVSQSLQNREDIPTKRKKQFNDFNKVAIPSKQGRYSYTTAAANEAAKYGRNPFKTGKIFLPNATAAADEAAKSQSLQNREDIPTFTP